MHILYSFQCFKILCFKNENSNFNLRDTWLFLSYQDNSAFQQSYHFASRQHSDWGSDKKTNTHRIWLEEIKEFLKEAELKIKYEEDKEEERTKIELKQEESDLR